MRVGRWIAATPVAATQLRPRDDKGQETGPDFKPATRCRRVACAAPELYPEPASRLGNNGGSGAKQQCAEIFDDTAIGAKPAGLVWWWGESVMFGDHLLIWGR